MIERFPPPPGTGTTSFWEWWKTYEEFPYRPASGPVRLAVLEVPLRMYGSGVGMLLKTDSLRPKFLARIDLGVCAIH